MGMLGVLGVLQLTVSGAGVASPLCGDASVPEGQRRSDVASAAVAVGDGAGGRGASAGSGRESALGGSRVQDLGIITLSGIITSEQRMHVTPRKPDTDW